MHDNASRHILGKDTYYGNLIWFSTMLDSKFIVLEFNTLIVWETWMYKVTSLSIKLYFN